MKPPRTFVIQPTTLTTRPPTHEELQALAQALGLVDDDRVQVTIVGDQLRITLTPLGTKALDEARR